MRGAARVPARGQAAFTLIELMVALGVLAILSTQLFLVFTTQKKAYVTNERILDVQEDARLVVDLLISEARMAGFMVQRTTGVSSIDGGATAADVLCLSDPSVMDEARVAASSEKFEGGSVTAIATGSISPGSGADFDVDTDGNPDFEESRGIIISDGTNTHCARMTDVDEIGLQIDFTPAIADPSVFVVGSTRIVPAVIYEVNGGGLGLRRNNMLLSAEVEDLQAEFGVDVNLDEVIDESDPAEFPLDTLQGSNPGRVRAVRLTVITRTIQNDAEYNGPGRPATANHTGGASDGFHRRRYSASVLPRNLL